MAGIEGKKMKVIYYLYKEGRLRPSAEISIDSGSAPGLGTDLIFNDDDLKEKFEDARTLYDYNFRLLFRVTHVQYDMDTQCAHVSAKYNHLLS